MNKKTLTLEVVNVEIKKVYGGKDVVYSFLVEHKVHTNYNCIPKVFENIYKVTAKIRFTDQFNIELDFIEVEECLNESNEETLTNEALLDLLRDEIN